MAKRRRNYPLELINEIKNYCVKIALHIPFYQKQVDYYNQTAYEIKTNKLDLILPTFSKQERQKKERYHCISHNRFY